MVLDYDSVDCCIREGVEMDSAVAAAEWVDPADLVLWAENPRKNDRAAKKLAEWFCELSGRGIGVEDWWTKSIVARRGSNIVLCGNTQTKAAAIAGSDVVPRVPVRFVEVDDRTAVQMAAADNRLGEEAEWDAPALAQLLTDWTDLPTAELMGWSSADLAKLADDVPDFGPLDGGEEKPPKRCPHCDGEL